MKNLILLTLLPSLLFAEPKEETTGLDLTLIAEQQAITAQEAFTVGLHIKHQAGYHTYWKNPGIVGVATQLQWELPAGFSASDIRWPTPEVSDMAGHPCHGYERDVTLLTTVTPPKNITSSEVTLKVTASWMCCAEGCYPGSKELTLTLPVSHEASKNIAYSPLFEKARNELPLSGKSWLVKLLSEPEASPIILEFHHDGDEQPLYFFSSDGQISSDHKQNFIKTENGTWTLTIPKSDYAPEKQKTLPGVLKTSHNSHQVFAKKS